MKWDVRAMPDADLVELEKEAGGELERLRREMDEAIGRMADCVAVGFVVRLELERRGLREPTEG